MAKTRRPASPEARNRTPVYEPIIPSHAESFVWRCDDYPLPWCVWNSHPECEIHLIRKGQGTCYAGDYIGPFAAGDLTLVGRNLPHNWVTPLHHGETVEQRDIVIQFDEDRLVKAAEVLPELHAVSRLLQRARRGLSFHGRTRLGAIDLVEAMGRTTGLDRLSLFLDLLRLLSASREYRVLSSDSFAPNLDANANRILREALSHLASRPEDDIRLSDMANLAGMTESSFSRFFKKNTGNTFSRHLSELRTGKACQLLATTDRPVTEICHDVGYFNISNFNRAFRALRGMTPSRYRRLAHS